MRFADTDPLDRSRFPIDEWALVETEFSESDLGVTETLFATGNGFLGMRGNVIEGRVKYQHGTFVNGFHETWPIRHAEEAFGFARVGQTIVNAPDSKTIRLYIDDEPLILSDAELLDYERRLDFRDGTLTRRLEWRTPSGKRVLVTSRRIASFTDRHLAVTDYDVELLDQDAAVTIVSLILNRQDGRDEYRGGVSATTIVPGAAFDPRKAEQIGERVLQPRLQRHSGARYQLGYRTTNSDMGIVVGVDHYLLTENPYTVSGEIDDDIAQHTIQVRAQAGKPIRLTKTASYHTSTSVPVRELADRSSRTLDRARDTGTDRLFEDQREWLDRYWEQTDVEVGGEAELQQAIRWNLFQLAQASARTDGGGVAAKGVSGSGYSGHYFWDSEIYVMPFLTYTNPTVARNVLRFRVKMLEAARARALELNQRGALFPWRTINGQESSAYYAAGTAQYHIDADISHAVVQYALATQDIEFLAHGGIDILVETARLWEDLGFWRFGTGDDVFHIHGVTGPDEYTTVVNDNLYTNVMARANLAAAAYAVDQLAISAPLAYDRALARLGFTLGEVGEWRRAAAHMHIPFDEGLGIHPQDSAFLQKELWDLEHTPETKRPLLLHYHPLVIYRFQVLKQADVVLALLLQSERFTAEQKLADFEYYDPLTTGDSTLSAVVQSVIAAEVGYADLAMRYFRSALYVDLADLHHNAADGVHVASTGGVWAALINGFAGFRDPTGSYRFDPRLPKDWSSLKFRMTLRGTRFLATVEQDRMVFEVLEAGPEPVEVQVRGAKVRLDPEAPVVVPLAGQGPRLAGAPTMSDVRGGRRSDGSLLTATIPTLSLDLDSEGAVAFPID
ncbi:glycosyl hydrolase family 65 protein [Agromyces seonyuensis]|uniref:Glycoside hydrolase family 65 protein n=1 Tax=Agromyces seonyuensis TaxID=2662446 RepID=A0A6I4P0U5_9MICO|nr:glycoside hydrolase family 65 protein [Agromyces seonyuensis]